MKDRNIEKIFELASLISRLKDEKRFKTVKNFDGDTVAAHSWRLAILVFLIAEELKLDINVLRAVKLALVHDFPEAVTGDLDAHLLYKNVKLRKDKIDNEIVAIDKISSILSFSGKEELKKLWNEYSEADTKEARYVYVLDKIEGVYTFIEPSDSNHYNNPDLIATYCIKGYKLFPELKPVLDFVQNKIKLKFDERDFPWKKEYDEK